MKSVKLNEVLLVAGMDVYMPTLDAPTRVKRLCQMYEVNHELWYGGTIHSFNWDYKYVNVSLDATRGNTQKAIQVKVHNTRNLHMVEEGGILAAKGVSCERQFSVEEWSPQFPLRAEMLNARGLRLVRECPLPDMEDFFEVFMPESCGARLVSKTDMRITK